MSVKILGVCGSPIKKGNTETLLDIVLESARATGDVEIELVTMADWKTSRAAVSTVISALTSRRKAISAPSKMI